MTSNSSRRAGGATAASRCCYGAASTAVDIGRRAASRSPTASNCRSPSSCFATGSRAIRLPIARRRSCRRADVPRHGATSPAMTRAAGRGSARRRDRRRPARPRSRLRSRQGRRCRDARSSDGPADGAPARRPRRGAARSRALEAKGIEVMLEAAHARISSATIMSEAVELNDGRRIDGRPRRDRRRHHAECGNRQGRRPRRQARHRRRRSSRRPPRPTYSRIGECAEHRGICYGLVEPANEQARVLAERLAGRDACYRGSVIATNLKVSGVNVFSAGEFLGGPGTEDIVLQRSGPRHATGSSSSPTAVSPAPCSMAIPPTRSGISTSSAPAPRSKTSATI